MAYSNLIAIHQDPDDIEPILVERLAVAVNPDRGRLRQLPLLSPVNGCDRTTEVSPFPGFDLDERHRTLSFDHQVDVAVAIPEPPIHNAPTPPPKPSLRNPLPEFPEFLLGRGHGGILLGATHGLPIEKLQVGPKSFGVTGVSAIPIAEQCR